jgi:hypothetical protein
MADPAANPATAPAKKTDHVRRAVAAGAAVVLAIAVTIFVTRIGGGPRISARPEPTPQAAADKTIPAAAFRDRLGAYRRANDSADDPTPIGQARALDQPRPSEDERKAQEYIRNQLLLPMQLRTIGAADVPAPSTAPASAVPVAPDDATRYAELQRRIAALRQARAGDAP